MWVTRDDSGRGDNISSLVEGRSGTITGIAYRLKKGTGFERVTGFGGALGVRG